MINRASLAGAIVVAAASLILAASSCSKKAADTGWKAEVEVIDGVRTVRNPETPRYGTFAFEFVEDLAIGSENDDSYLFPKGVGIAVDDEGKIIICDFGGRRVQVVDSAGKYIRTLGRQGQGPGEFQSPSSVMADEAGNVLINDRSRSLVIYSPVGLF